MEIPKINNQPRAEVEKTPQENEGLLNDQEQESGKRENIVLEIDGKKIEAVKYYFEYPERIQKETGILGYERVKIQNTELSFLMKEIPNNARENLYNETSILNMLSSDEYPYQCFNHVIGGFAGEEEKTNIKKDFKKDRFFLQKIYDVNTIERKRGNTADVHIFNHPTYERNIYPYSNFSLYNKNTNSEIFKEEYIGRLPDYKSELEAGDTFGATIHGGLNLETHGFWHRGYGGGLELQEVAVGFPVNGTDDFFLEYLEESLKKFILILSKNTDSYKNKSFYGLFTMYAINKYSKKYNFPKTDKDVNSFLGAVKDIWQIFLSENNLSPLVEFSFNEDINFIFRSNSISYPKMAQSESFLPIFIHHDEIPQLAWGHAKYAHYKNEKELNFFKFKHADHLPVKKRNEFF